MQVDVHYSPVGERPGPGAGEFCLYVWIRRVAVIAAHVTAVGLTILMSLLSRPGTRKVKPGEGTGAFQLTAQPSVPTKVSSLGILCLCLPQECSPFCFQSRKGRVRLHWLLQVLVLLGGVAGVGFMVASKCVSERPHLASWHSVLGVWTLAVTVLQVVFGLCLLFPKLPRTPSFSRLKLYHATCGLVAYLLAVGTVTLAMFTDWFQATVRGVLWYVLVPLPLLPAVVIMNQITSSYLPKRKINT